MTDPLIPCPVCSHAMDVARVGTLGVSWCPVCAPEGFTPPQDLLDAVAESPAALREALKADTQESRDARVSELLNVPELPDLTKHAVWSEDYNVH